jgi:hypothetical protein
VTEWFEATDEQRLLLEPIAADDFDWFDTHDCRVRVRPTVPGEFLRGDEHLLGCGLTLVILVNQNELLKTSDMVGPGMTVVRDE